MNQKSNRSDRQSNPVSLKPLSICHLLQHKLRLLISPESPLSPDNIPVYRLKHPTAAIYRTSLLHKFNAKIKQGLVTNLSRERSLLLPRQEITYEITTTNNDYINFHFPRTALHQWLRQLALTLAITHIIQPTHPKIESHDLFLCQYSHARSCSLLRLACREGLIASDDVWVTNFQISTADQSLLFQFNPLGTVLLCDPHEKRLALNMLTVVDSFESGQPHQWQLIALKFCQAFLDVEQYCRIFGLVKREQQELAQSRLWLMMLFQRLLQKLLQEKLDIIPLREL